MCLSSAVIASQVRTASLQPLRLQPAADGSGGCDGGHAPSNRWGTRPQHALLSHSAITPPVRGDEFDSFQEFLLRVFKPDLNQVFSASTSQSRGRGVTGGGVLARWTGPLIVWRWKLIAQLSAGPTPTPPLLSHNGGQSSPPRAPRPPFDFANEFSGGRRASVYVALSAFVR